MSAAHARSLLINAAPGEAWGALCDDGGLIEVRLERAGAPQRVGSLHLGRVVALKPELPAALVDIGLARPAFLSVEDADPKSGIAQLHSGQAILVQVTKDARGDKAAGVTLRPRLTSRLLVYRPLRPGLGAAPGIAPAEAARLTALMADVARPYEGFVLRAEAVGAEATALVADVAVLRARWDAAVAASRGARAPAALEPPEPPVVGLLAEFIPLAPERIVIDERAAYAAARGWLARHPPARVPELALHAAREPLFDHAGIAGEIENLFAARLGLPSGGAITIETTTAATTIDVDTGGAAILATNLEAAHAIARQVRLRNLAGPIVIDFVAMKRRADRDQVSAALAVASAADPERPELLGWTRLGHFEIVRKRSRAPLAESLFERVPGGGLIKTPLTVALDVLRRAAREADAAPGAALTLRVNPEVAAMLGEGAAKAAHRLLEATLGRPLPVTAETARARDSFDIRRV